MTNLLTKQPLNQIQFFQMPKALFQNPKYMAMSLEAKVAYMLLLDLLPLSIENDWVNQDQQVYVKLSRTKLMALLGIKGTQKAAKVMKELVDCQLIINKRIGLGRCNEIYLYPLEEQIKKEMTPQMAEAESAESQPQAEEAMAEPVKPAETAPATSQENLGAAMAEVEDLLQNQIHIEDLKQQYDPDFVEEIGNNICEMFVSTKTRIGQQDKPMAIMQEVIRKLKMHHIDHVIRQFMAITAKTDIYNPKGYLQSMIYNAVFEANTRVVGDIRRQFGYHC